MSYLRQVLTFTPVASMLEQCAFLAPMQGGDFMTIRPAMRWSLVFAGMLGARLVALTAFTQKPAAQPSTQLAALPSFAALRG